MYNIDIVTKPKIINTLNNFLIQGSEHFHFLLVQIDRRDNTIDVWREKQGKEGERRKGHDWADNPLYFAYTATV